MNTAPSINALFSKPDLLIGDPQAFDQVKSAIGEQFSSSKVRPFLASLESRKIRIRDFEKVVDAGLLGTNVATVYASLGNGDQGQIREFYLASLERVTPELRQKFFKLYSYY